MLEYAEVRLQCWDSFAESNDNTRSVSNNRTASGRASSLESEVAGEPAWRPLITTKSTNVIPCRLVAPASVCLSVRGRMPTLLHGHGCDLVVGRGCP